MDREELGTNSLNCSKEDSDESSEEERDDQEQISIFGSRTLKSSGIFGTQLEAVEIPSFAEVGEDVTLLCRVSMGKWENGLHSLKWFKNDDEFYSFKPLKNGKGTVQITRRKGVRVKAKTSWPDAIVLRKVNLKSTGVYRCQIITKQFDIQQKYAKMTVIEKLHKNKKKFKIPSFDYLCMGRGRGVKSLGKYWKGRYWKKYCREHLEDREEKIWIKHMMEHLAKEEETKWRAMEKWKEVDKKWRDEGKKVTFNTELQDEPEDEDEDLGDRMHNFLDSVWGGYCSDDDACSVISYCNKDGDIGSCRILWWFYIILALIIVIHLFYCFGFIVEFLTNGCKIPSWCRCCFPCFECRISRRTTTSRFKKNRKPQTPSTVKIVTKQPK